MKLDLSLPITEDTLDRLESRAEARGGRVDLFGHMGTHLDLMGQSFDLDRCETSGVIFDVSAISDREIQPEDVNLSKAREGDFIVFRTGLLDRFGYGNDDYFRQEMPQTSYALIDELLAREIAFIGVDMGGARKAAEHRQVDEYCAERGVFIIENLANLEPLSRQAREGRFRAHIYPLNLADATGLPCRVIAEIQ